MSADGTGATAIYRDTNAFIGFLEWSPNDRLLLDIDKAGGGELDLYAVDPDGTDLTVLAQNPGDDSGGRLSSDGRLAFWSDSGPARAGAGIYVTSNEGTPAKVYEDRFGLDTVALAWSPDAQEITWTGKFEGGRGSAVYLMLSAQGENLRQLIDALPEASGIDWR